MAFSDFLEQSQVTALLQRSLERGRLGHAYLFSGNDLDELESMARTLAKTLNCENPRRSGPGRHPVDSCDKCLTCRRIDEANHSDITVVRPESKSRVITIDQMRDVIHNINLKPAEAPCKIGIISAVDRMNPQAANAFLKTLEEPPGFSVLILLTTEPQRILETIISRCLRLTFAGAGQRLSAENLAWLGEFSESVARQSGSGLLARYKILSQLATRLGETRTAIEAHCRSRSPLEHAEDVDPKLRERWEEELTAAVEAEYRRQRADVVVALQWWIRDVWMASLAVADEFMALPQFAPASKVVAGRITRIDALENLRILDRLQRWLNTNVQEALALEVGLLKLKL